MEAKLAAPAVEPETKNFLEFDAPVPVAPDVVEAESVAAVAQTGVATDVAPAVAESTTPTAEVEVVDEAEVESGDVASPDQDVAEEDEVESAEVQADEPVLQPAVVDTAEPHDEEPAAIESEPIIAAGLDVSFVPAEVEIEVEDDSEVSDAAIEEIVAATDAQVRNLFPSAQGLNLIWSNVVKLAQSLYREAPGMEPYRPQQRTPVANFYLAGSYTRQDYIDSMEGATMSGRLAAAAMLDRPVQLATNAAAA